MAERKRSRGKEGRRNTGGQGLSAPPPAGPVEGTQGKGIDAAALDRCLAGEKDG